jgi:uridine kinase
MPFIIAVGGGSGSGKTTLARSLQKRIRDSSILSYDSYYRDQSALSLEERAKVNFDDPKSLDEELYLKGLSDLHQNKTIEVPVYDFATHTRQKETTAFAPTPIILVEGILVFSIPNPKKYYDYMIYADAESDIRLCRRILRDEKERGRTPESVIAQYLATVRPMHKKFVEPGARLVDFVFENSSQSGIDESQMAILLAKIEDKSGIRVKP